jgi:hypothetical protein
MLVKEPPGFSVAEPGEPQLTDFERLRSEMERIIMLDKYQFHYSLRGSPDKPVVFFCMAF